MIGGARLLWKERFKEVNDESPSILHNPNQGNDTAGEENEAGAMRLFKGRQNDGSQLLGWTEIKSGE